MISLNISTRYGLVNGSITIGGILGMVVYGMVSTNTGFVTAYLVSIGLGLVTMVLTFVLIKREDIVAEDSHEKSLCRELLDTINPIVVFRNCYSVLFKPRPGHNTVVLCLAVLACSPLTCVPIEGE